MNNILKFPQNNNIFIIVLYFSCGEMIHMYSRRGYIRGRDYVLYEVTSLNTLHYF